MFSFWKCTFEVEHEELSFGRILNLVQIVFSKETFGAVKCLLRYKSLGSKTSLLFDLHKVSSISSELLQLFVHLKQLCRPVWPNFATNHSQKLPEEKDVPFQVYARYQFKTHVFKRSLSLISY